MPFCHIDKPSTMALARAIRIQLATALRRHTLSQSPTMGLNSVRRTMATSVDPKQSAAGAAKTGLMILAAAGLGLGGWYAYSISQEKTLDADEIRAKNSEIGLVPFGDQSSAEANGGISPSVAAGLKPLSAAGEQLLRNQSLRTVTCHFVDSVRTTWLNANNPLEDRHSEHLLGEDGVLIGMYDGHSGAGTSDTASFFLPNYIKKALADAGSFETRSVEATCAALSKGMLDFDFDLTTTVPDAALASGKKQLIDTFVPPALSGAVACIFLSNPTGMYVANTGDCRAVLGVARNEGEYGALIMSNDQTADTKSEVDRIRAEHPGEPDCIKRGRVQGGLQPSRAFGDSKYKWSNDKLAQVGIQNRKLNLTPPYVTAEPEVLFFEHHDDNRFVILATDGVWDVVPNDVAVTIVGKALEQGGSSLHAASQLADYAMEEYAKPVGGVDKLMAIQAPDARRYRDDITVSVIQLLPSTAVATPNMCSLPAPAPTFLPDVFARVSGTPKSG
eukprot:m.356623 g.356623  ORF g.356623 m.356623 type:complete len:503 (-) comp17591_c0_seq1:248-1756(-)